MKTDAKVMVARAMANLCRRCKASEIARAARISSAAAALKSLVAAGHAIAEETTELRDYTDMNDGATLTSTEPSKVKVYRLTDKGGEWLKSAWTEDYRRVYGAP